MDPTATITTFRPHEAVAAVPILAGYLTYTVAADRIGRTPWQIREPDYCRTVRDGRVQRPPARRKVGGGRAELRPV